jgi:hypothetical protein
MPGFLGAVGLLAAVAPVSAQGLGGFSPPLPQPASRGAAADRGAVDGQNDVRERQLRTRRIANLVKDEAAVRRELDRFRRYRSGVATFAGGGNDEAERAAMTAVVEQLGHVPQVASALQETVDALGTTEFLPQTWQDAVEADGRFVPPPRFLRRAETAAAPYAALEAGWSEAARALRDETNVGDDVLLDLEQRLAVWGDAARPVLKSASRSEQQEALRWSTRVAALFADMAARPQRELGQFLRDKGFRFPGGTLADLVDYLLAHRLGVRPGGRAQAALAAATTPLLAELDAQIAVLEDRIEFYKEQRARQGEQAPYRGLLRPAGAADNGRGLPRREITPPPVDPLTTRNVAAQMP